MIGSIIKNVLKGSAIGIANVIPGVSGGTIAVILGIYERLLKAIGDFFTNKEKRKEYFIFLSQILLGVLIGIVVFAKIFDAVNSKYPGPTRFFFLGLIASSIPFIVERLSSIKVIRKPLNIFFLILGAFLVLLLAMTEVNKTGSQIIPNMSVVYGLKLLFCGMAAASAMIIPGVSGSFLLIVLGEYNNVIYFVNERQYLPLIIIGLGAGLGIILFAKIITYILEKYKDTSLCFIIGLIGASLYAIYPGFTIEGILPILNTATFVVGFMLAYILGKISK